MSDVFDAMLGTLKASAIGVDIVYTPATGPAPPAFRGFSKTPDIESELGKGTKLRQQASIFEVFVSDLPIAVAGDTFLASSTSYRVTAAWHKDQDRRIWLIEAARV